MAAPANRGPARRPSSAWSRPRERARPNPTARGGRHQLAGGGAGGGGGLRAVGWRGAAAERSGKVSLEVKTAAELGALRGAGGAGVSGRGRGCLPARWGGPGPRGGRSPNKGSLGRPPWRPCQPRDPAPPSAAGPVVSVARAPLTQPRVCVPGAAMSHGPKQPGAAVA